MGSARTSRQEKGDGFGRQHAPYVSPLAPATGFQYEGGGELAALLGLKMSDDGRHLLRQRPGLREEVVLGLEVLEHGSQDERALGLVTEPRHVSKVIDALQRLERAYAHVIHGEIGPEHLPVLAALLALRPSHVVSRTAHSAVLAERGVDDHARHRRDHLVRTAAGRPSLRAQRRPILLVHPTCTTRCGEMMGTGTSGS
jgi:hypothetical protein